MRLSPVLNLALAAVGGPLPAATARRILRGDPFLAEDAADPVVASRQLADDAVAAVELGSLSMSVALLGTENFLSAGKASKGGATPEPSAKASKASDANPEVTSKASKSTKTDESGPSAETCAAIQSCFSPPEPPTCAESEAEIAALSANLSDGCSITELPAGSLKKYILICDKTQETSQILPEMCNPCKKPLCIFLVHYQHANDESNI